MVIKPSTQNPTEGEKQKSAWKRILGTVVYVLILAGLIYGIPRALSFALKTPYPMASISSGSMWPVLKKGDLVLIRGVQAKAEVQIGDIVVYRNPEGFTIHRVVELREDTLVTKGDANNVLDAPTPYTEIVGKMVTFKHKPLKAPLLGNISLLVRK